jgi:uncharacterized membrane protein
MITKEDWRNMILSHPGNTLKKWKLKDLTKSQLIDHWGILTTDEDIDQEGETLYNEHNIDYENNPENNPENDQVTETDLYKRITQNQDKKDIEYDVNDENEPTYAELKKCVVKLKSFIKKKSSETKYINDLIDDVKDQLNELINNCYECTKQQEDDIYDDIDYYITKIYG